MAETIDERPRSRLGLTRHPYSALLLPVPIVCFTGAFLTDLSYDNSGGNLQWVNFSSWLLAAGLLFGVIAAILMLIDFARLVELRTAFGWGAFALLLVTLLIEFINSFGHLAFSFLAGKARQARGGSQKLIVVLRPVTR